MKSCRTGLVCLLFMALFVILFSGCKKESDPTVIETATMIDIDGNIYKTVKIGTKWWMAENLKVTRYRNGDSINYIANNKPDSEWAGLKIGAYSYFDNKFGFLYNFYSLSDPRNIAPAGWHIPTDDEWKDLETNLGMGKEDTEKMNWRGSDQGNKLKIEGGSTTYWAESSDLYTIFGNNQSGFSALGGACRIANGQWGDLTHTAFWWTSTMNSNDAAWYRGLDFNKSNVFRYYGPLTNGYSVRCVKD
jgi:uncharacterized protein (TIGR02145 family)